MNENSLHYLWKFSLLNQNLVTTDGVSLKIVHPGILNKDAGPDFFNARIKIEETLWAGNVEIHVKSSDFKRHGHHHDERYQNIILHVVYEDDDPVCYKNGEIVPTLALNGKFEERLLNNYTRFMNNKLWVPCANLIRNVEKDIINRWIDKLSVFRLNNKAASIERALVFNNMDWELTFYQYLASGFGFYVNSHAFELLSKSLPLEIINKHKSNPDELEALLYGQAGFLNQAFNDIYPQQLQKRYLAYKKQYSLQSIDSHLWNFLRLRPSNFPTIRLAQFAQVLKETPGLFQKVLEYKEVFEIQELFNVSCPSYWETHYLFDKPSVKKQKRLGTAAMNLLIINTVIPFFFVYGQLNTKSKYIDKAISYLKSIPAENNHIIRKWSSSGIYARTAYESQAMLLMTKNYCMNKKCLECEIGTQLLKDIVIS